MVYCTAGSTDPSTKPWARAWPQILTDTAAILTRTTEMGISVYGPDGHGALLLDPHHGIAFTGVDAPEPLRLAAPHRNPYPSPCGVPAPVTGSCHTGRARTTVPWPPCCCAATCCSAASSCWSATATGTWNGLSVPVSASPAHARCSPPCSATYRLAHRFPGRWPSRSHNPARAGRLDRGAEHA